MRAFELTVRSIPSTRYICAIQKEWWGKSVYVCAFVLWNDQINQNMVGLIWLKSDTVVSRCWLSVVYVQWERNKGRPSKPCCCCCCRQESVWFAQKEHMFHQPWWFTTQQSKTGEKNKANNMKRMSCVYFMKLQYIHVQKRLFVERASEKN